MKQETIIRVVTQNGKLSLRTCIIDQDGDIVHVSSEPFAFKADDRESLNIQMMLVQGALSLPILTLSNNARSSWLDQPPFLLDELE